MYRNSVKTDGEAGQLDCGIYSSPAAAGLLCKVGSAIAAVIARYILYNSLLLLANPMLQFGSR